MESSILFHSLRKSNERSPSKFEKEISELESDVRDFGKYYLIFTHDPHILSERMGLPFLTNHFLNQ